MHLRRNVFRDAASGRGDEAPALFPTEVGILVGAVLALVLILALLVYYLVD
jgi:hypothetical protein